MNDTIDPNKKSTLTMNRPNKLSLTKTVESGKVKQNFTHGRSKTVTVEVRKTRTFTRKDGGADEQNTDQPRLRIDALRNLDDGSVSMVRDKNRLQQATSQVRSSTNTEDRRDRVVLSREERARLEAKQEQAAAQDAAASEEAVAATQVEAKAADVAPADTKPAEKVQAAAKPADTAPARRAPREEEYEVVRDKAGDRGYDKRKMRVIDSPGASAARSNDRTVVRRPNPNAAATATSNTSFTHNPAAAASPAKAAAIFVPDETADDRGVARRVVPVSTAALADKDKGEKRKIRLKAGDDNRRSSNKLTVSQALDFQEERMRSLASVKRQREKMRRLEGGMGDIKEKVIREVVIPEAISVQELANRMAERVTDVIKSLMKMGTLATANQSIDADTAELVVSEFGHNFKRVTEGDVENILIDEEDNAANLKTRAPVVTIMGHVDHGKTSLLDALRKTNVVEGEAGGITQHIGAYQVRAGQDNQKVTFLDTPGHEAFTAMRSRGAKATDIVVLVVAADDGIKAQTEEAISHARAANVPIIVAINKIDKPGADVARVKMELMQHNLVGEEFGGDIQIVEVSAKQRLNLDGLIDSILLQSEVLDLKANPNRKASGVVVEAKVDKGRGVLATMLVQRGTLRVGDLVVAGASWGRVRAMLDDKSRDCAAAKPSQPVEIQGLGDAPLAGDNFDVVDTEKTAREITEYRAKRIKDKQNVVAARSLDQLFAADKADVKELPLVIKGDVQGSVEAIIGSVMKFNGAEVSVKVAHSGVGAITESDVSLANATGAIIVGFNVRATANARDMARRDGIDIRYYSIIYDLVDDVKAALSGLLSPEMRENLLGYAEIRDVFNITKVGKVAGCMVTEGMIKRGAKVRLLRDNVVIHEGTLKTLKRFKDEVKEVKNGYECGMAFENYDDIRSGDMIEAFEMESIARAVE